MKAYARLDLSAFEKAIRSLEEALAELSRQKGNTFVRDATIQRFEYTYELSWKMLKRYLEMTEATPSEIDQMSFPVLIRTGAEKGLLKHSWDVWASWRTARNLTSHTYDEAKALEVVQAIPSFLEEAVWLFESLQERSVST